MDDAVSGKTQIADQLGEKKTYTSAAAAAIKFMFNHRIFHIKTSRKSSQADSQ